MKIITFDELNRSRDYKHNLVAAMDLIDSNPEFFKEYDPFDSKQPTGNILVGISNIKTALAKIENKLDDKEVSILDLGCGNTNYSNITNAAMFKGRNKAVLQFLPPNRVENALMEPWLAKFLHFIKDKGYPDLNVMGVDFELEGEKFPHIEADLLKENSLLQIPDHSITIANASGVFDWPGYNNAEYGSGDEAFKNVKHQLERILISDGLFIHDYLY